LIGVPIRYDEVLMFFLILLAKCKGSVTNAKRARIKNCSSLYQLGIYNLENRAKSRPIARLTTFLKLAGNCSTVFGQQSIIFCYQ